MDIKKVAVLGAGAVGSYVIWGLSARRDIELGVVADGPRGERLKKDGCAINGKIYRPAVWTPQEAHDADLLIVCLKYGALPGALDSIKAVTGPHTTIMSLMNGVDSEDIIASAVGGEHLLYSLIKVASHKEADGFHFDPATTVGIIFGEKEPPCDSPRVKAVEALFGGTELHFRATDCIREEMWSKFRLNVCNNLPQAILGAGVGCYRDSVHMKAISDGLRRELEAIAAAEAAEEAAEDAPAEQGGVDPRQPLDLDGDDEEKKHLHVWIQGGEGKEQGEVHVGHAGGGEKREQMGGIERGGDRVEQETDHHVEQDTQAIEHIELSGTPLPLQH